MSKLSHTKIVALEGDYSTVDDSPFDAMAGTIIDMEDEHPELLDSSVYVDLGKKTLGTDVTITYTATYVDAVAHADKLILKALEQAGVHHRGEIVVDEEGPRSLALT